MQQCCIHDLPAAPRVQHWSGTSLAKLILALCRSYFALLGCSRSEKPAMPPMHSARVQHLSITCAHSTSHPCFLQAQSKPMCEILARLTTGGEFEVITFGDRVSSRNPAVHGSKACATSAVHGGVWLQRQCCFYSRSSIVRTSCLPRQRVHAPYCLLPCASVLLF
jgi:hypothetical protein